MMGKDFESSLLHWQPAVHSLNAKSSALPIDTELQRVSSLFSNPHVNNTLPTNGTSPNSPIPLPADAKEPHGWFYCLPRFRQGFMSEASAVHDEKPLPGTEQSEKIPTPTVGSSRKQFLVFDQSGDKTTLIYTSDIGTPLRLNPWNLNSNLPVKHNDVDVETPKAIYSEAEDDGEMREDTEEINALLYSDDDSSQYDDESDDNMSTGHSPNPEHFEVEDGEEVASSFGPIKRQRVSEDGCDSPPSELDTARSFKNDDDDDTESMCPIDTGSTRESKRSRKERIRETVEALQCVIPGAQGKDAAAVLDESIRYLRSLKSKAKSLGLSSL